MWPHVTDVFRWECFPAGEFGEDAEVGRTRAHTRTVASSVVRCEAGFVLSSFSRSGGRGARLCVAREVQGARPKA